MVRNAPGYLVALVTLVDAGTARVEAAATRLLAELADVNRDAEAGHLPANHPVAADPRSSIDCAEQFAVRPGVLGIKIWARPQYEACAGVLLQVPPRAIRGPPRRDPPRSVDTRTNAVVTL